MKLHVTKSPRPSPSVFAYCKPSNTGGGNSLGTRLMIMSIYVLLQMCCFKQRKVYCAMGEFKNYFMLTDGSHSTSWRPQPCSSLWMTVLHTPHELDEAWVTCTMHAYMHHSAHYGHVAKLYMYVHNEVKQVKRETASLPSSTHSEHAGMKTQGYCHLSFIPHVTHFVDYNSVQ